jgi:tetratricopeptide (TPR) repeat protein
LLPTPEKDVLHSAAVLGRAFELDAVAAVERNEVSRVATSLESLEQRALVRHERERRYAFGHVLVRDVAYAQIPRAKRAEQHRLAAEWLESVPERVDEHVDSIAYHYATALEFGEASGMMVGDLPERTRRNLGRAGERSLRLHAYRQAQDYFEHALALGADWRIYEGLGRALHVVGRRSDARLEFEQALAQTPDRLAAARLNRLIAGSFTSEYRFADAHEAFDRAEQALDLVADTEERWREWIDIQIAQLTLLYWQQDVERMETLIERARPVIERVGERRQQAEFLASEYLARLARDRYRASDETLAVSRRFLAARQELGDPLDIARAHFNVGFVYLTRGDLDEAQPELEQALATAERTGDATLRSRSLTYLALLHRRRRDVEAARAFAEHALDAATDLQMSE